MYRLLILTAACLALIVIVAGAYVRLSDAGLGCPDWPGCYGRPTPAHAADDIARAIALQGSEQGPVSFAKAWKEMGHRYLAGILGVLILAIAAHAWLHRSAPEARPWLATAVVALVALQAALGMWTVTLLLKPAIVTAHLLGGLTVLVLLVVLCLSQWQFMPQAHGAKVRFSAALALGALTVQIALGGWVSANYAALACPELPWCDVAAAQGMDFAGAFHVMRELGQTPGGALLTREALAAIHWTHRVFALAAAAAIAWAAWCAARIARVRALAAVIGALLVIQFALGLANVLAGLPLAVAVAHNLGAALLVTALVVFNFFCFSDLAPRRTSSGGRP